jgi:autotransporter-associated beta strand protein
VAATVGFAPSVLRAAVTLTQTSNTDWGISNGNISLVFNPSADDVTTITLGSGGSASANLLGGSTPELDEEFAGTPFGAGTETYGSQVGAGGSYVDVWTTTASTGNATNPITYSFHYLVFANDPTVYCYEVLNHAATDPATSVGQGQFLFRSNPSLFPNLLQVNTGPNQLKAVTTLNVPSTNVNYGTYSGVAGRQVQNAAVDLTGSGIPGDNGTNYFTKYDYSVYTQFYQAETMYGSNYAVTEVDPSIDTLTGGPTKQELAWTDPGILNMEFLSDHYGTDGTGGSDPGYGYTPTQGVATTRLFGPYGFTISSDTSTTASTINQNAINAIPNDQTEFNSDAELAASGYINTADRGAIQINASNSAGWSSNTANNTVVLSEPGVNFQESTQGYQYWGQLSQSGNVSISNVVPGTYRLSLYELGQWGETRVEGVQVGANGQVTIPPNLHFTPQNFGTAAPIWTLGTPNRSANEFMNGHNATGADQRQYQGSYNYWAEEQALGNPGKVVYYATSVGSTPATNNPNDWIANQWGSFDPGEYDATNDTTDNYAKVAPAYVTAAGGPATYTGAPWEIHFTTTAAQDAQGSYVVLSVGLAASECSLIVTLNGNQEIFHYDGSETSDPMIRSGVAGFYQFLAFQFPESDLIAPTASDPTPNDEFTFSVSQSSGVMYDAMRMEITNTSANPTTTGWDDYYWITGANSQVSTNDAAFNYQILTWGGGNGTWDLNTTSDWSNGTTSVQWSDNTLTGRDSAVFGSTAGNVTLNSALSAGALQFTVPGYTIAGTGNLTLGSGGIDASQLTSGNTTINTLISLVAPQSWNIGAGSTLTVGGNISGNSALTKSGLGSLILGGSNSYSGGTIIAGGNVTVNSGASLSSGDLTLGQTGANNTLITLNNAAQSIGNLATTWAATSGSETQTLTLNGTALTINETGNTTFGAQGGGPTASITGAGSIIKAGTGTLTLTGSNSFTGAATISAGTLTATSAYALGAGNVTVAAHAALNYYAASDTNLRIGGGLAINSGNTTAPTTIGASIGGTTTSAQINVNGAATTTAGNISVNIYPVPGATPITGNYTLVVGNATSTLNNATYKLGTIYNDTNFTVGALGGNNTTLTVGITADAGLTSAYWTGNLTGATNVWSASNGSTASNWVTAAGGGATPLIPGSAANLFISATSPALAPTATVLGANMTINTLTISNTTSGLGLNADGNTLTITPSSSTTGITMSSGVPASTIAANVALGAAQTWTNNSGSAALTVSGVVSGASALTITGNAPIVLSGSNSYSGSTTISGGMLTTGATGTLALGSVASSIGSSGNSAANLILNGGTLQYANTGAAESTDRLFTLGPNGGTLDGSGANLISFTNAGSIAFSTASAASSLTLTGNGTGSLAAVIGNSGTGGNTTSLTKNGTGTWTALANNTYTGVTTINAGILSTGTSGVLAIGGSASSIGASGNGSANLVLNGGTLQYANAGAAETTDRLFTLGSSGGTLDASGTNLISFTNTGSIAFSTASATSSLNLTGSGTGSLAAVIGNSGTGGNTTSLTKNGTGTWTALANNTYTGVTTINGGILSTGASGSLAIGGSASSIGASTNSAANLILNGGTLQYANTGAAESTDRLFTLGSSGGTLDASGTNLITFAGNGAGSANAIGYSTTNTSQTLTLTGTGSGSFAPIIANNGSGVTSLMKEGTGAWQLSGSNTFTGGVTVVTGTLLANNSAGSATGTGNITAAATTTSVDYSGGRLGGNGTMSGSVTLAGSTTAEFGGVVAAGSSNTQIGTLHTGNATWNGGAAYQWKISAAGSNAALGTGASTGTMDELSMPGLTLASVGGTDVPITIAMDSLTPLVGSGNYSWIIAQTTASKVSGFSGTFAGTAYEGQNLLTTTPTGLTANATNGNATFALDTTGFGNGFSFSGSDPGIFTLDFMSNGAGDDLVLNFTATPEPDTACLIVLGCSSMLMRRRRSLRGKGTSVPASPSDAERLDS